MQDQSDPLPPEDINCCIAIGKKLTDFWLEHGEKSHVRRITQKEALDIIEYQRSKGSINTMYCKVATGGKTGVLCSCRPEICVALHTQLSAGQLKYGRKIKSQAPSGYLVSINEDACKNCGKCTEICHFNAMIMNEDGKREYKKDLCWGCGLCTEHCPQGALSLYLAPDETGLYPLDIDLDKELVEKARAENKKAQAWRDK
ncbi:MAG: 4Fe-4S binding protein [Deltaproteobacteria bacterium]|nr:4Fe-4S binding protein [Deltaproteobacteria bacterium]